VKPNRAQRVLLLLESRPGWFASTEIERVGGRCAWRTAVSEARQIVEARGGQLVNRVRHMGTGDGKWLLSEYRVLPKAEPPADLLALAEREARA